MELIPGYRLNFTVVVNGQCRPRTAFHSGYLDLIPQQAGAYQTFKAGFRQGGVQIGHQIHGRLVGRSAVVTISGLRLNFDRHRITTIDADCKASVAGKLSVGRGFIGCHQDRLTY